MKYRCSHCSQVFEQHTTPTACPLCKGEGKARMPKGRLPAKRMTNKQRRIASNIDPETLKLWHETRALDPEPLTREKVVAMALQFAKKAGEGK